MREILKKLEAAEHLSREEMRASVLSMMQDASEQSCELVPSDLEIESFLRLLSMREVSLDELVGAAEAMREKMLGLELASCAIDTCGTGGSGFNTFNTSTLVAFVLAAAGIIVCKHGNRASSSLCGSADFLEACGYKLDLSLEKIPELLARTNFCFLFAPKHHPATKRVAGIRKKLGVRTIFNFLGPLSNPASVRYQLLGVSSEAMQELMAQALYALGSKRALVVRSAEGLDEISLSSKTRVLELRDGKISEYSISPEEFSLSSVALSQISARPREELVEFSKALLAGQVPGPYEDLVALNAGAAFCLMDKAASIAQGVLLAKEVLRSGAALSVLERAVELSNSL